MKSNDVLNKNDRKRRAILIPDVLCPCELKKILITAVLSGKSKESTTNWLQCKFTLKIMPEAQDVLRKTRTLLEFFSLSLVVDSTSS